MRQLERAVSILEANEELLKQFHVRSLSVFGSVARGEAGPGSDIDLLVDFEPGARIGLFAFAWDQHTMGAVVRRLTIIGEAAARVPEFVGEKYRHIPWAEMRAMRNFIVHEYFGISEQILWETIQMDLPAIIGPLEALLESGKEVDET